MICSDETDRQYFDSHTSLITNFVQFLFVLIRFVSNEDSSVKILNFKMNHDARICEF